MDWIMKLVDSYHNGLHVGHAAAEKTIQALKSTSGIMAIVYVILAVVIAGVAAFIGIFMMQQTYTATALTSSSVFYNTSQTMVQTENTSFSFFIVLIIAAIGGIAMGYLFGMIPGMGKQSGGPQM